MVSVFAIAEPSAAYWWVPHGIDQSAGRRSSRCNQSPLVRGQSDWRLAQLANGSREWNRQSASPPHTGHGRKRDTLIQSASSDGERHGLCKRTRCRTKRANQKPAGPRYLPFATIGSWQIKNSSRLPANGSRRVEKSPRAQGGSSRGCRRRILMRQACRPSRRPMQVAPSSTRYVPRWAQTAKRPGCPLWARRSTPHSTLVVGGGPAGAPVKRLEARRPTTVAGHHGGHTHGGRRIRRRPAPPLCIATKTQSFLTPEFQEQRSSGLRESPGDHLVGKPPVGERRAPCWGLRRRLFGSVSSSRKTLSCRAKAQESGQLEQIHIQCVESPTPHKAR
jgi:hypothetical protein